MVASVVVSTSHTVSNGSITYTGNPRTGAVSSGFFSSVDMLSKSNSLCPSSTSRLIIALITRSSGSLCIPYPLSSLILRSSPFSSESGLMNPERTPGRGVTYCDDDDEDDEGAGPDDDEGAGPDDPPDDDAPEPPGAPPRLLVVVELA